MNKENLKIMKDVKFFPNDMVSCVTQDGQFISTVEFVIICDGETLYKLLGLRPRFTNDDLTLVK